MSELTIGDRVKIVRQDSTNKGQEGTVYDILPGRPFPYHVWVDGWSENMGGNAYTREELERVAVPPKCPFCPLMLPGEPELWEQIGNDFHGSPATIGGIAACEDCALVASLFVEHNADYIAQVARRAELTYQAMRAIMDVYAMQVQAHLEAHHA